MNIQKFKNYNHEDAANTLNFHRDLFGKSEERSKTARIKDEKLMEYVGDLQQDGKDGIIYEDAWFDPFTYFISKTVLKTLPAYVIGVLSLLLYIPIFITWFLGKVLKICLIWTPFYDYFVYFYGYIYMNLIKLFGDIFISNRVLEETFVDEEEIKLLYLQNKEFADYSVWELFYKK